MNENEVKPDSELTAEERAKQLPTPAGHKILCAIPQLEATYEGSIIERPDNFLKREAQATVVLFVVKIGKDAYKDKERFPGGPWCAEGDFVVVRMYAGTRFTIHGKEFCIIHDDQVEAVAQDPRGIGRA